MEHQRSSLKGKNNPVPSYFRVGPVILSGKVKRRKFGFRAPPDVLWKISPGIVAPSVCQDTSLKFTKKCRTQRSGSYNREASRLEDVGSEDPFPSIAPGTSVPAAKEIASGEIQIKQSQTD